MRIVPTLQLLQETNPTIRYLLFELIMRATVQNGEWCLQTSSRELCNVMGMVSYATINRKLQELQQRGMIRINNDAKHTIIILDCPQCYKIDTEIVTDVATQNKNVSNTKTTDCSGSTEIVVTDNATQVVTKMKHQESERNDAMDYDGFMRFFNEKMEGKAIKPITRMTDKRKEAIRARLREYKGDKRIFLTLINNASSSSFMNGENDRGWVATIDWMLKPTNFVKVIEGNYNREPKGVDLTLKADPHGTTDQRKEYDRQVREQGYRQFLLNLINDDSEE